LPKEKKAVCDICDDATNEGHEGEDMIYEIRHHSAKAADAPMAWEKTGWHI